jgi:hypothetical protein
MSTILGAWRYRVRLPYICVSSPWLLKMISGLYKPTNNPLDHVNRIKTDPIPPGAKDLFYPFWQRLRPHTAKNNKIIRILNVLFTHVSNVQSLYGENKLHFDEMMMISVLDLSWIFMVLVNWNNSLQGRHVIPLMLCA